MKTDQLDEPPVDRSVQYHILPQADGFTVKIIYPQNSIHRVGGFKSENDAQIWIGEAQVQLKRSRWFD